MLRSYFLSAFRNLLKNKAFSVINILGLTAGMVACLFILQYVVFERSYDSMHEKAGRIFRVAMAVLEKGEKEQTFAFTFPAVAPSLRRDFPEVESALRFRRNRGLWSNGRETFQEFVYFTDSTLLDIFSFPVVAGDARRALGEPFKGMLSASLARKYFGDADPIGQYLESDDGRRIEILAVFKDLPENSHIDFDFLISYVTYVQVIASMGGDAEGNWGWSDFYTYLLLKEGVDAGAFAAKLPGFAERYRGDHMRENHYELVFRLQPLRDIHLYSDLGYELRVNGNARYVYFLVLIAVFILFIAWFNYINLSTARSLDRAREVGIRKVVGAHRGQLIRQFLLESALVNALALILALFVAEAVFPAFRDLVGKELSLTLYGKWQFWFLAIAVFLGGALLAGLYPAFVLSGFRPLAVLKGNFQVAGGGALRKGLVALQFVATIGLVAGTLVVYRQLQFMRQQDLGIDIEQTLVLNDFARRDSSFAETISALRDDLEQHPGISSVTVSGDLPGKEVGNSWNLRWARSEDPSQKRVRTFAIDDRFVDQYGMELLAGRKFSEEYRDDSLRHLIANETALRVMGIGSPEAAIGEQIQNNGGSFQGRIVGVVKDYHQEALKYDFKPIFFYFSPAAGSYYSLKINTSDLQGTMAFIEDQWRSRFPDAPFNAFFLDDFFNQQYQADRQFGRIFGLFTLLAIAVASLGLFGLSSFNVTRRAKEISIRKVLGAGISQILVLLSKEYLWLILVAGLLALPLAYWLMSRWLTNYAYSIKLGVWFFLAPLVGVILIAALTVSCQALKAALANPVERLRQE